MFWQLDDLIYSFSHKNLVTVIASPKKSVSVPFKTIYHFVVTNIKASNYCTVSSLDSTYWEGRDVIGTTLNFERNILVSDFPTLSAFSNEHKITLVFPHESSDIYYGLLAKKIPCLNEKHKEVVRKFINSEAYRKMTD